MSTDSTQQEPGVGTGELAAKAGEVLHGWLGELEQIESGLVRLCHRRLMEQAFSRFVRGERELEGLQEALAGCSRDDLERAARLLWSRASELPPPEEGEAQWQPELLAFASSLEQLSLVRGEQERAKADGAAAPLLRPTEVLRQAAAELRTAHTPAALGQALAEGAAALCDARGAIWWRRVEGGVAAAAVAGLDLPRKHVRFRPGPHFWSEHADAPSRATVLSAETPEQAGFLAPLEAEQGVVVRLRGKHQWLGAISVYDGDFSQGRLDLLAALAEQGAAAWQSLEAEQAREAAATATRDRGATAAAVLASARNLEDLLTQVCALARTLSGADTCCFLLADQEERLRVQPACELPPDLSATLEPEVEALAGRVGGTASRRLLWLNTAKLREAGYHRLLTAGYHSALAAAFTTREQALGALVLLAKSPSAFGAHVRRQVEAFVAQAAAAAENMQLFENAQRRLTEMSDLTWVSGRVAGTLEVSRIAQDIARAAANVLNVPRVAIFLAQEEGEFAPLVKGQVGFEEPRTEPLPATGHLGAQALDSIATHAIGEVGREGYASDPLAAWMEATSLLCAPLIGPQGLRGLIVVADDVPRVFDLHTVTLLATYANQAALAFQSAVLYQRTVQHLQRLTKLEELSEALAATEDPGVTATLTLAAAAETLDAPVGLMWIMDLEENELELKAVRGLRFEEWGLLRVKPGEDLAGRAAQFGRPQVSSDVTRDGRVAYRRQAREMGLKAALAVPLLARGHTVGVLSLYRRSPGRITEEDTRVAQSLANIAAVSLENANLAREAQRRSEFVAAMMNEANHRMRNSLQAVAGLLRMELERPQAHSTEEVVRRGIAHVQAVAAVHEVLREQDVLFVDMKEAAGRVVRATLGLLRGAEVDLQVTGARVLLPAQKAISVALVLNELVDNALRHGLAGRADGKISVSLAEVGGDVVLQVRDNGAGVAGKAPPEDGRGLGLKIVRGLVEQELGGTVEFEARNGFTVRARFSKLE